MAAQHEPAQLVAIVGPTASGKTALAIELARRVGGEVIAADSRTVYRYLDIGTAKPTKEERQDIPHYLLDVVGPGDPIYTAAHFKADATALIADIRSRGKVPIIVGGSGLYIDGLLLDYDFGDVPDGSLRAQLNEMSLAALHDYAAQRGIELPENAKNKRHVVRAIEQGGINRAARRAPEPGVLVLGLQVPRDVLKARITARTNAMFAHGLVEESRRARELYGPEHRVLQPGSYAAVLAYIDGTIGLKEARDLCIRYEFNLAKRQMTWFRRRQFITWCDGPEHALDTALPRVAN